MEIFKQVVNTEKFSQGVITRTRDSNGNCNIKIMMGSATITFDNENGYDYEGAARELKNALDTIIDDPCLLTTEVSVPAIPDDGVEGGFDDDIPF